MEPAEATDRVDAGPLDLGPVAALVSIPAALRADLARYSMDGTSGASADRRLLRLRVELPATRDAAPPPPDLPCRPAPGTPELLLVDAPWFDGVVDRRDWSARLRPLDPDSPPLGTERRLLAMLRMLTCMHTMAHGGLALHGATVVRGGRATVFLGRRRSGKTTLVRRFSEGMVTLGDDLALLTPDSTGFRAHGSPFSGRERTPAAAATAPLARVCVLEQGEVTAAEPVPPSEAARLVLRHAFLHVDSPTERGLALDAALRLTRAIEVLRLRVHLDTSPWTLEALA